MALLIDIDAPTLASLPADTVATAITSLGQRQYISGWRWGLVCGLVAGTCTTLLGSLLVYTVLRALGAVQ